MTNIEKLISFLEKHKDNRGMMADLRRGFSKTTECRAWPHIAPFCELRNERERKIVQLIAAGFATHLGSAGSGNMGGVLRKIAEGDGKGEKGLKTFEGRFRRLLAASSSDELCDLLPGIIRTAERKGISIDFKRLFWDLISWEKKDIKLKWASSYWDSKTRDEKGVVEDDEVSDADND